MYTYHKFKEKGYIDINNFFIEGISTWLGGNVNFDFNTATFHLDSIIKNGKIDIKNKNLDTIIQSFKPSLIVNTTYVLGGLICKYTFQRYGKEALWEMIQDTASQEKMTNKICKQFGVTEKELGKLFLELIAEELKNNKP